MVIDTTELVSAHVQPVGRDVGEPGECCILKPNPPNQSFYIHVKGNRQHLLWKAVGSRQHPVLGYERAPTDMTPAAHLDIHLPWPRPFPHIISSDNPVTWESPATHCKHLDDKKKTLHSVSNQHDQEVHTLQ